MLKKKSIFLGLVIINICLITCGCSNSENLDLLIGEWEYNTKSEGSWGNHYNYQFYENGKVEYFECLDLQLGEEGCESGSSVWIGKYKLNNNIITMTNFKIDKDNSYNPSNYLRGPQEKMIVDFENMYFCKRNEGLDCEEKFEKYVED